MIFILSFTHNYALTQFLSSQLVQKKSIPLIIVVWLIEK